MPFGLGKKGDQQQPFITNITDKQDLEEINKIAHMLNPNEEVFVVARLCALCILPLSNSIFSKSDKKCTQQCPKICTLVYS
jgi:hypothetical protein